MIPREDYRIDTILCDDEDFAIACMRANLKYKKNNLTVVHILERREYTGCVVNFKTYTNSILKAKSRSKLSMLTHLINQAVNADSTSISSMTDWDLSR